MQTKIIILLSVMALSCGPAHKLRKAEKLMNQAIAMGAKVRVDTVTVTKVIPGEKTEVKVPVYKLRDTTIVKDMISIHFKTVHDTVRLSVDCPPDTIKIPVTITKNIECPPVQKGQFWKGFGYGILSLIVLLIIYAVSRLLK